ncbi:MAG: thioredoxin domain-containing protein, partial [Nitrososphaerales archaeon]
MSPQKFETLAGGSGKLAVFFSTQDCTDCAKMSPVWQRVSEMYGGSISFLEVSYSLESSQIFAKYNVVNTPTFILFVDGSNVSRHNGLFSSPNSIEQFVQNGSSSKQSSAYSSQIALLESESPAILISVVLGIGVFASPCVLPLLPGYLGFLVRGESKKDKRRIGISSFAAGLLGIL